MSTHSAIYRGRVRHRRNHPAKHEFSYSLSMLYLDLDEAVNDCPGSPILGTSLAFPLRFNDRDYLPIRSGSLREEALHRVHRATGLDLDGPVRLLTQVRTLGFVFNPVSFFYCFDRDERLRAVISEITNTPWKERHCYVSAIDATDESRRSVFAKRFHVSPFMEMDQTYRWAFSSPARDLNVVMENHYRGQHVFTADLDLRQHELSRASLAQALLRHPLGTASIVAKIHWQALRLWSKRVPFHSHPSKLDSSVQEESP